MVLKLVFVIYNGDMMHMVLARFMPGLYITIKNKAYNRRLWKAVMDFCSCLDTSFMSRNFFSLLVSQPFSAHS